MGAERRRHPRLERPIEARWDGASGRGDIRITSLSLGGCFVDGWGRPGVGEIVRVELQPQSHPLSLSGRVAYCDPSAGFGLQFLPLAPGTEEALVGLLRDYGLAEPYGETHEPPVTPVR